ncbi:hypothetical protein N7510_004714 [Penicillium lagena]|uniref:uncharacterized protein n=1 Tax=Penicillium lagena TaxID=94218 RepID=UPI0025403079|nr:uncharacterized protein N7510_004714 [Penicillium lagena]KAJ5620730.1 hypothetical protein N7510_004714 [Penicillium lagena]
MAPTKRGNRKIPDSFQSKPSSNSKPSASRREAPQSRKSHPPRETSHEVTNITASGLDLDTTIPLSLQQLLLDVFKTALLPSNPAHSESPGSTEPSPLHSHPQPLPADSTHQNNTPLDTKSLIQTIKSHLYQRDFDSAFTDADEDLLRAYALRWSAARALGYAGLFRGILRLMRDQKDDNASGKGLGTAPSTRVVCVGGGAGAEIVALAAAWRDLGGDGGEGLGEGVAGLSLTEKNKENGEESGTGREEAPGPRLAVTAVDIADWTAVVERLSDTITSTDVPTPSTSKHQPPLVREKSTFSVSFQRADVLTLPESELNDILVNTSTTSSSLLVTLMFTLNELFSTSMPKSTTLLLRMTESLPAGTVLLVVDSPGSYSTVKLKGKDGNMQERKYPMKFLLDHTLLTVAEGKWERVFSQDSRWWRRDAPRLRYEVGEGAGLEDMRFQVHVYRRVEG